MWVVLLDAPGYLGRKQVNRLLLQETNGKGPLFGSEEAFNKAIAEGFVEYEEGHTIVREAGQKW